MSGVPPVMTIASRRAVPATRSAGAARVARRANRPPAQTRAPQRLPVTVQNACRSTRLPPAARIAGWVRRAAGNAAGAGSDLGITVRFVSRPEAAALNRQFRGRRYAPNVLSFPAQAPGTRAAPAGDIAICPPVVASEARAQGKTFNAHLAHLVVHGVLHLRGYDHVAAADAVRMERLESKLVTALGHRDPWADEPAPRARITGARARPNPARPLVTA
jgi:probable rRNA maturation factor